VRAKAAPITAPAVEAWVTVATAEPEADSVEKGLQLVKPSKIKKGLQKDLYLGNLDAKRDWGHAKDYVNAMWLMLQQEKPDDYVIATGETYSVEDFLTEIFTYSGLGNWRNYVKIDPRLKRPNEVPYLLGDSTKARTVLGWKPEYNMQTLARRMFDSDCAMLDCGAIIY
jgi:GDPmannose 4,6-dehydratase